jgi:hypothetical protein
MYCKGARASFLVPGLDDTYAHVACYRADVAGTYNDAAPRTPKARKNAHAMCVANHATRPDTRSAERRAEDDALEAWLAD